MLACLTTIVDKVQNLLSKQFMPKGERNVRGGREAMLKSKSSLWRFAIFQITRDNIRYIGGPCRICANRGIGASSQNRENPAVMAPVMKHAKTRKGKKYLENRQPKFIENDKQVLIAKGGKCSEAVSQALTELYALKKPLARQLKQ